MFSLSLRGALASDFFFIGLLTCVGCLGLVGAQLSKGLYIYIFIIIIIIIVIIFLAEYLHTLLKGDTNSIQGLWISLLINTFLRNRTCILTLAGV
ncbi:hypothetical protein NC651_031558 [Populus alba x Populus x berolinensis]|nr:hypothetical protein NC651_031558 [Populus alba x Populus x berolinensis]